MKKLTEMTISEAKMELEEAKNIYEELSELLNVDTKLSQITKNSIEQDHGWCIVVLDKGFMYVGALTTDGEFLTINNPSNIRYYSSGKGLLWHAANGPKDMTLDPYPEGTIKAPYSELKHFIPTDKSIWK